MKPSFISLLERAVPVFATAALAFGACVHHKDAAAATFETDASSVAMGKIEPSYCSSIDGVDYSLKQYFSNASQVSSVTGLVVKQRTSDGVCCTGAKVLSGGACTDPVPTEQTCAALGMVLVAGKCQTYAPQDLCPVNSDLFAGRFGNSGVERVIASAQMSDKSVVHDVRYTQGGNPNLSGAGGTFFDVYLTFNVADTNEVQSLVLRDIIFDDHMFIEINGRAVHMGPGAVWRAAPYPHDFRVGEAGLRLDWEVNYPEGTGGSTLICDYNGEFKLNGPSKLSPKISCNTALNASYMHYWWIQSGSGSSITNSTTKGLMLYRPGQYSAAALADLSQIFIASPASARTYTYGGRTFQYGGTSWLPAWMNAYGVYDTSTSIPGTIRFQSRPTDLSTGWTEWSGVEMKPYLVTGVNVIHARLFTGGGGQGFFRFQAWPKAGCVTP